MKGKRVLVYVQHLLGIGHLKRAAAIARAMAGSGLEVTLVSGGLPLPGLAIDGMAHVQLAPAVAADSTFKVLLDAERMPIDEDWKRRRRETLLEAWRRMDPHALVIELFPFGRRQMRFELIPLLDAATDSAHRPVIISSVRDILGGGQKNPARQAEMRDLFDRYFDHLLVHGDPELIPFERTFLHTEEIKSRLHYTGYVVERSAPQCGGENAAGVGHGEVVVSAGGGAVGFSLLECAVRAQPLSAMGKRTWRILIGVNADPSESARLTELATSIGSGKVVVEPARPDFTTLLANCAVSVSQGGYNTIMEILRARASAVVIPFAGGAETEQTIRASLLADRGLIETLDEDVLDPAILAAAVDRAANRPRGRIGPVDLGGAECTARLVGDWTKERLW